MPKRQLVRTVTVNPKRSRSAARGTRVPRSLDLGNGFPMSKTVKMKYVETFRITPTLSALGNKYYRANGIYDTNQTGGGHQPYTHDTWQGIYNHYQVLGCSIRVQGTSNSATPVILGVRMSDDSVGENDPDSAMESNACKYSVGQDLTKLMVVNHRYNAATTIPGGKDVSAAFGADPTEQTFFQIFARTLNPSTTSVVNVDCMVEITYTVKMWEVKDLGKS